METINQTRTKPLFRGTQVVWYILGLIEVLLGFRFFLKLAGANPLAGFSNFIYTITTPFAGPFLNVFPRTRVEGSIFEWTTLLAMAVYALVAWGIIKIFVMSKPVSTPEAAIKLDQQE
ncbi:MAG TPA: YggT family protein [bacterium]|jgi:hypothetical protein|nr:YggT family protein [bacterium]